MGGELKLVTPSWSKDMFDGDEELEGSVESFLAKGKGRSNCDTVNCTWIKKTGNTGPMTDIHTFIGGANNEFIVVPRCERSDYEYVLEKITTFCK
jgi:hypothetical protein